MRIEKYIRNKMLKNLNELLQQAVIDQWMDDGEYCLESETYGYGDSNAFTVESLKYEYEELLQDFEYCAQKIGYDSYHHYIKENC